MPKGLNKKVLCFVDEHGVAGAGPFCIGAVVVLARLSARVDKCFSDQLEPSANEIHSSDLNEDYLKGLLQRFWRDAPQSAMVMVNLKAPALEGPAPVLYAQAVVHTVKAGLRRFQQDVLRWQTIGNVELILDRNAHNTHPAFDREIAKAQTHDGRFKGIRDVTRIDSAAARLLQLADCVAYARKWVGNEDLDAAMLRERFGIQLP